MVRILALALATSIPAAPAQADNATFGKIHGTLRAAAKTPAPDAGHGRLFYVTTDGCSCARSGPWLNADAAHLPQRRRLRPDRRAQADP